MWPTHNMQIICKLLLSLIGNQMERKSRDENKDEDETVMHSDTDSESLLLPVPASCQTETNLFPRVVLVESKTEAAQNEDGGSSPEHTTGPSVPHQSSAGPSSSPDHLKPLSVSGLPPCTSSATSPPPLEIVCISLLSPPSSPPVAPPSDPEPTINSTKFWRNCNTAGCTQAIFTNFINEMNDISSRIQSDQASQDDYDLALSVITASGKLSQLVAKQQEELQRKQVELKKAAAAMKEVVSALRR
ncbi:uncharacterized protein phf11 isoform X3 [Centropristis striata]|uniref:uncharacterized protein phf11 isoform X3 n=1 Tax=Centropristis striata TaxID=184440 RepID=UPI0027DFB658|nr:uncharacterized protein phf11 isoform X3 [Centropristis striata]